MDSLKSLVRNEELKTDYLDKFRPERVAKEAFFVRYDPEFDAIQIQVVHPKTPTRVHYLDEHIALLYNPDDMQIVGVQVESFAKSFLPKHVSLQKAWRLRAQVEDYGELINMEEERRSKVAREVISASKSSLGRRAQALEAAFAI